MKSLLGTTLLILWGIGSVPAPTAAQEEQLPEEARRRLDYAIGSWRSETQVIDENGEIKTTIFSEDQRAFVVEDRIVEITGKDTETGGRSFVAWEYYDVESKKYTLTSIDRNGTLWSMKGDLGETFVWTSDSRKSADGRSLAMRFTHYDIKDESFSALGELSRDGGKTWRVFSKQFLTRIDEK